MIIAPGTQFHVYLPLQHVRTLTELFAEQRWIPVLLPRVLLGDENPGRLEARQPGGRGHVDVAVITIPHHHPLPEVPALLATASTLEL